MLKEEFNTQETNDSLLLNSHEINEIVQDLQSCCELLTRLENSDLSYRAIKNCVEQTKDKLIMYLDSAKSVL